MADRSRAAHLRYQHKPFFGSSHTWAMAQCARLPADAKILDLGSGSGAIGRLLRERSMQELYAVEIDEEARRNTAHIYRRIETSLDKYSGEGFDLILVLDVFEHLHDPEAVYAQAAALLQPGGTMLVSVPNIAHWSTRFSLLFGNFNYTERGILDRTHVRFFTRRTFRKFLKRAPSMTIQRIDASISPMEFVLPEWVSRQAAFAAFSKMRYRMAQWMPGLLAYQHLAILRRNA